MTEADTSRKFAVPLLQKAGWDNDPHSIAEQRHFTASRIVSQGPNARSRPGKRADYLLRCTRDLPLAVVEAKAAYKHSADGLQQAKDYATILFDTPQREISSHVNSKLLACQNASIVAGFLTPSGIHRPTTLSGMQQVRADVEAPSIKPYEYPFGREEIAWWPIFSTREELHPSGDLDKAFDIADTLWQKVSDVGWKLVTGLKHSEGSAMEKDALALELAKPESGSFILVSLRRRLKTRNADQKEP